MRSGGESGEYKPRNSPARLKRKLVCKRLVPVGFRMSRPEANTMRYWPGPNVFEGKNQRWGKSGSSLKDQPARSMVLLPRLYSSSHGKGSVSPVATGSFNPLLLAATISLIITSEGDAFGSTR